MGAVLIYGKQPLNFAIGDMDQSFEEHSGLAPTPGTMLEIVNLRKDAIGYWQKRNGYQAVAQLAANGIGDAAVRGWDHLGGSVAAGRDWIYELNVSGAVIGVKDSTPKWILERCQTVASDPRTVRQFPACVSVGGMSIHVWTEQLFTNTNLYEVFICVIDEDTGATIRGPECITSSAISGGTNYAPTLGTNGCVLARAAASGTGLWIVWQAKNGTANSLYGVYLLTTDLRNPAYAYPAPTTLVSDVAITADVSFDMASVRAYANNVGVSVCWIAYTQVSGGVDAVKLLRMESGSGASVLSTTTVISGTRCLSPAVSADNVNVWVAYVKTTAADKVELAHLTAGSGAAPTFDAAKVVITTWTAQAVGNVGLAVDRSPTSALDLAISNSVVVAASHQGGTDFANGTTYWQKEQWSASAINDVGTMQATNSGLLGSQPFFDGRDWYAWLEYGFTGSGAENAADRPFFRNVLVPLTRTGGAVYANPGGLTFDNHTVMPMLAVGAGRAKVGTYVGSAGTSHIAPQRCVNSRSDFNVIIWAAPHVAQSEEHGNSELRRTVSFSATGVTEYRCRMSVPIFLQRNVYTALAATQCGQYTIVTGGCQPYMYDGQRLTELGFLHPPLRNRNAASPVFAYVYEYTDARGFRQRSAPAFYTDDTLSKWSLMCTAKQDRDSNIGVQEAHPATQIAVYKVPTGDTTFYRAGAYICEPENAAGGVAGTVTPPADADLKTQEVLYTQAGELANEFPPPATHCATFGNRLAFIDAEQRERIYFSKPLRFNRAPEFSSALETFVRGIGPLTALMAMDGLLYAFSATGVAIAASGDGQDASGNGVWPQPQIISSAAGCVDARAICVTADGIIYCSDLGYKIGIWLLPRGGGTPIEIGARVRNYLRGYGSFSGSVAAKPTVVGCANWAERGRVLVTIQNADVLTSCVLEYDYAHKGPDGLGCWNASVSLADSSGYAAMTSWVAGGQHHVATMVGNYVFKSIDGLYMDTLINQATPTWIGWYLLTFDIRSPGMAPRFKLNTISVFYRTMGKSVLNMAVRAYSTVPYTAFTISSFVANTHIVRQWQPPVRRNDYFTGLALELQSLAPAQSSDYNSADCTPIAVTMDLIPFSGFYNAQASERL